jgi:hypothetical protein
MSSSSAVVLFGISEKSWDNAAKSNYISVLALIMCNRRAQNTARGTMVVETIFSGSCSPAVISNSYSYINHYQPQLRTRDQTDWVCDVPGFKRRPCNQLPSLTFKQQLSFGFLQVASPSAADPRCVQDVFLLTSQLINSRRWCNCWRQARRSCRRLNGIPERRLWEFGLFAL